MVAGSYELGYRHSTSLFYILINDISNMDTVKMTSLYTKFKP